MVKRSLAGIGHGGGDAKPLDIFLFLIVKECNEWDPQFRNEILACLVMKHELIYLCRGGGRRKHMMGIRFVMILVWENTGLGGPD